MMQHDLIPAGRQLTEAPGLVLPAVIDQAGAKARRRFVEFFTAHIRNPNTRRAYATAVLQFCDWLAKREIPLGDVAPVIIAAYIESHPGSPSTVKQHLAAIGQLFDYLVLGQVVESNPAAAVRGPKLVVKKGKTIVLSADDARQLLDAINIETMVGLRDRALIGVMVYSFARVSAAVTMNVGDYYANGKRWWFRLQEKGGKHHEVPAHHKVEEYMDAYLAAAGIDVHDKRSKSQPLFRSFDRRRQLTERRIDRRDVWEMVKRRAKQAGVNEQICCHTFRATGITAYLENGGTLEHAQRIAAHESARTTKLYDRTDDTVSLDEIEKVVI